jgi:hypothetical protein
MGWERRDRGGHYYVRSRRVGGRVVREYIGGGDLGILAAHLDERAREQRETERTALRSLIETEDRLGAEVAAVDDLAETLARMALIAAGYRQHHRGKWRKRRES